MKHCKTCGAELLSVSGLCPECATTEELHAANRQLEKLRGEVQKPQPVTQVIGKSKITVHLFGGPADGKKVEATLGVNELGIAGYYAKGKHRRIHYKVEADANDKNLFYGIYQD